MLTDTAEHRAEQSRLRRQVARVRRCHRKLAELRQMVPQCAVDPAGWRLRLLEKVAVELCEALTEVVAFPDDEDDETHE
jgi:hypothetical protein